ncbi:amidohydrolase [Caulobacter sp. NIBR1757]|uniref:amidohydrolase n=1 Tax=Caulobacter sp. NIBR1757 TaxID=3016000 RepID=UPI0022F0C29E|nr:amidohydrolase [Caulobacter sp. NIBR1757]WGM40342.1 N-substituted formamide deformylase [Caulobacter sp. NIBR1757]
MHKFLRPLAVLAGPILGALVLSSCAARAGGADGDDFLMFGGPIFSDGGAAQADGSTQVIPAEALVVRDGKVVFAGDLASARVQAKGLPQIDLKGAAAYPGFVDSHVHLTGVGLREMTLNLDQVKSVAEMTEAVKAWNAAHPGAEPLTGRGWIETHWPEKRFPTKADLDAVVADRPVVLERADGHAVVLNTAALALAGITKDTPDPSGGRIERDAAGQATGMLIDTAQGLIGAKLPPLSYARRREALEKAVNLYAARGWTGGANMSTEADDVKVLFALAAEKKLPITVDVFMTPEDSAEVLRRGPYSDPTGMVRVRGVKLYMDGALGSRGALLLSPYSDQPAASGLQIAQHDEALAIMKQALKVGADIAFHAIGDRGNRQALDWMAEAFAADPTAAKKVHWRIEHSQIVNPADYPRFRQLGVIASMQPSHAIGDLYFAPARLGEDRLKGAYAWRSLTNAGALVIGGTDAPVEVGDPRIEYYAAAVRKDLKGASGSDWHAEEALNRVQALHLFTLNPAQADHRPAGWGRLVVGSPANITVFSRELLTAAEADIPTARPVLTVVRGRTVFDGR